MAKIKLQGVRLSFPSLFRKAVFQGDETKYEATLLLDKEKHADSIAEINEAIKKGIASLISALRSNGVDSIKDIKSSSSDSLTLTNELTANGSPSPTSNQATFRSGQDGKNMA